MKSDSGNAELKHQEEPSKPKKGMKFSFFLLASVFLLGILAQHVMKEAWSDTPDGNRVAAIVFGLTAFVVVLVAGFGKNWHRFFCSNRFAVPVILAVAFLSILGTLILQNETEEVMRGAYGKTALSLIHGLFLDDLFHSFGFVGVVGVGAGGLALTVSRKRRMTVRYTGSVFAHVGLLLILVGAVVGNSWGLKGRLNMHRGQSADRFFLINKAEQMVEVPLGFTLRLDEFRLQHYQPDFRLMIFEMSHDKEKLLMSMDPATEEKEKLRDYGLELIDYWPDHLSQTIVEPLGSPDPHSVAALGIASEGQKPVWAIDAGDSDGGRISLGGLRLVFFKEPQNAKRFVDNLASAERSSSPHWLLFGDQKIPVEVGQSYQIPGMEKRIEVLQALPDFVLDGESRTPKSRSDSPNNPAIELAIKDKTGKEQARSWLFAKFPDFHGQKDSPIEGLLYQYLSGSQDTAVDAVVVGASGEWWQLNPGGKVSEVKQFKIGDQMKLGNQSLSIQAMYLAAKVRTEEVSASDQEKNPLARIRRKADGQMADLKPESSLRLDDNRVLVLAPKGGDSVKDYLSTLSVLDEKGQKVLTQVVEVNAPLSYGGFTFYQSDYRPEDPTFSGFQVVKDPGLWIVYLGFFFNTLGVFVTIFVQVIIKRKPANLAASPEVA